MVLIQNPEYTFFLLSLVPGGWSGKLDRSWKITKIPIENLPKVPTCNPLPSWPPQPKAMPPKPPLWARPPWTKAHLASQLMLGGAVTLYSVFWLNQEIISSKSMFLGISSIGTWFYILKTPMYFINPVLGSDCHFNTEHIQSLTWALPRGTSRFLNSFYFISQNVTSGDYGKETHKIQSLLSRSFLFGSADWTYTHEREKKVADSCLNMSLARQEARSWPVWGCPWLPSGSLKGCREGGMCWGLGPTSFSTGLFVCSVWLWAWVSGGDGLAASGGTELCLGLSVVCMWPFSTPVLYRSDGDWDVLPMSVFYFTFFKIKLVKRLWKSPREFPLALPFLALEWPYEQYLNSTDFLVRLH